MIFYHARSPVELPRILVRGGRAFRVDVSERWLKAHPLTAHLLAKEREEWRKAGWPWVRGGA